MRAAVDSSARTIRPLTFSLARSSSSSVAASARRRASSSADDLHRLGDVVGPRADVEADLAGVGELPGERVDACRPARAPRGPPGTAATTTARRGSCRARAAAKRRSSSRGSPGAPRQTWYCSVSLRWKRTRGRGAAGAGSGSGAARAARAAAAACAGELDDRVVVHRAGGGDDDVARARSARVELADASTGVSRDHRRAADDGRPSGWSPKTASPSTSKTVSCGSSSYIAISSSTIWRSGSTSRERAAARPCRRSRRTRAAGARRSCARRPTSTPCRCRR